MGGQGLSDQPRVYDRSIMRAVTVRPTLQACTLLARSVDESALFQRFAAGGLLFLGSVAMFATAGILWNAAELPPVPRDPLIITIGVACLGAYGTGLAWRGTDSMVLPGGSRWVAGAYGALLGVSLVGALAGRLVEVVVGVL
jgi:hypothetical protein